MELLSGLNPISPISEVEVAYPPGADLNFKCGEVGIQNRPVDKRSAQTTSFFEVKDSAPASVPFP